MQTTATKIIVDPFDRSRHVVAAGPVAPNERHLFLTAPPEYHSVAKDWLFVFGNPHPWSNYRLEAPVVDRVKAEFTRVQGPLLQRRDYVVAGGLNSEYRSYVGKWHQDLKLFLGIVEEPPADLKAELAAAAPLFTEYGMGQPGVFQMIRTDDHTGEVAQRVMYCLWFPETKLPATIEAIAHMRAEDIADDESFEWASIITDYHWRLVRGGIHVPKLHPGAPLGLQQRNAALKEIG